MEGLEAVSTGSGRFMTGRVLVRYFLLVMVFGCGVLHAARSTAADAPQLLHNTAATGSTKYNFGASYTCQTCHPKSKQATANIKKVLTNISTPIGRRPVTFKQITTASDAVTGIFGNDERTNYKEGSRNVCEVCHHLTIYHNYSNSKIVNKTHLSHRSNRKDCNNCHKHSLGYRAPQPGQCTDCHGVPPTNPSELVAGNNALGLTPPPDAGAHHTHRNVAGMECHTCHNNYGHGLLGNTLIEMGFRIDRKTWSGFSGISTVMGGTFTGTIGPPFTDDYAVAPGNPNTVLLRASGVTSCDVYCHGGGGTSIWKVPSGRANTAVSWVQGPLGTCSVSACHGASPANPPTPSLPGAHSRHVGDLQMDCTRCHDAYSSPHMINGRIKWNLTGQGANAKYKGFQSHSTSKVLMTDPYGKCTNVYCHSNVQNPTTGVGSFTTFTTVTWGGNTALQCDSCHRGKKTDANPINSGAHSKHISTYSYVCAECHKGAGADGALMNHLNNNIELAFDRFSGSYEGMPTNAPGDGYSSCTSNYCHSDGKGSKKTISWGSGPQSCTACHLTTGITTGKHAAHVNNDAFLGTSYGCVICHAATVVNNTTLTASLTKHVNKFGDYTGLRAGRYSPATGACTASYCHSDGKGNPPTVPFNWNDASTINDCKGCHGAAATPGFVSAVGEPNYVNSWPVTTYANSHDKHMGGVGLYTCVYCHDDTVTSAGLKSGTLHLNGSKNVKAGGGKTFNYPAPRTCDNISCHGGPAQAIWGQPFPADCTGCHGNNESTVPFKPISSGRHLSHIGSSNQLGKGFRCATCHALTANPDDRSIADTSVHGNGFKNYTGRLAGGRSSYSTATGVCSNAYCHSDGKGTAQSLTTANGWKASKTVNFGCTTCHGNAATTGGGFVSQWGEPNYANLGSSNLRANDHQNHIDLGAVTCSFCHASTVASTGLVLTNTTSHANRRIDVKAGNGKSFDYASRTCSNISCHGGKGSYSQVWGTTPNPECTGCHGNNAATTAPFRPISSGRHKAHINNAATLGVNYACAECHAQTVNQDDRTFSNRALHGNGLLNYSGARAGKLYTAAQGNCANTYCHTNGKGGRNVTFTTATGWNSSTVYQNCIGCHGNETTTGFTSQAGEPNYPNSGAPGSVTSNSHGVHVGTAGAAACYPCHADVVGVSGTSVNARHLNRLITYSTSGVVGKTFRRGAGRTCSNIACHGAGSPTATWGGTLACNTCHGDATSLTTGRHQSHINNAGQIGTDLGCADCHAQVVSSNTTFINRVLHANGFNNYSGRLAGKNVAACNASYCHSNGKGAAGVAVTWNSVQTFANCNGCHGTSNSSGFPDYPNSGATGSATSNSHATHATALTWKGAESCELCHFQTVTSAGTAILGTGRHLNGNAQIGNDVVFNTVKAGSASYDPVLRSCSNTLCHGAPAPVWGDASSAGCKTCHSSLGGAHAAHIGNIMSSGTVTFYNYTGNRSVGTAYGFGCSTCHPMDAGTYHRTGVAGNIDLSSNVAGIGRLRQLNSQITAPGTGYTKASAADFRCNLVYCHSDGRNTSTPTYRQSPNWYGGPYTGNKCGMCHDNPPQYAGQSHYVAASNLGNNGRPPYREAGHMVGIHFKFTAKGGVKNGFLGFSSSGSMAHGNPALATTISCVTCHSGIVSPTRIDTYAMNGTASQYRCGSCHTAGSRTPLQVGQIVDTTRHLNGVKDVAFPAITFKTKAQLTSQANALGWQRSGSYKADDSYDSFSLGASTWDPQTKTCLTACHVNQPGITWGAQLQCFSCHANQ